jgi:CRISPR-associated protein Cmr2
LYVAAIPWIEEVLLRYPEQARAYATSLCKFDPDVDHEKPHQEMTLKEADKIFASLDANCFHIDALGNSEATFTDIPITAEQRRALQKDLHGLYGKDEKNSLGPPASFYALLLMDGDRVGSLLADPKFGGEKVSEALATFTKQVQGIVENHKGSTVYAGGDDVLAMVPVPTVLQCARELREAYRKAFNHDERATTSAGIVLAHIRRPLLEVLDEAHRLLDDIAKEGNGRDSIAISLLRSGDRALQWTSTWQDENGRSRIDVVTEMREMWRAKSTRQREGDKAPLVAGEMSSGLVYRLRETMGLLCAWPRWEAGVSAPFFEGLDPQKLFAAEIRRMLRASGLEGEDEEANQKNADEMAAKLLELVHPVKRTAEANGNPPIIETIKTHIGMDGLLLALFLSTDGKERDHGAMEARS